MTVGAYNSTLRSDAGSRIFVAGRAYQSFVSEVTLRRRVIIKKQAYHFAPL